MVARCRTFGKQADAKEGLEVMTEASQARLFESAKDLQALLKRVGKAKEVMVQIETERGAANRRLAKLRDERTALQLKLDALEGDSKAIETQIAKLDEVISDLRALLQSVYGGGLMASPAPKTIAEAARKTKSSYVATGEAKRSMDGAEARRVAIVQACADGPKTMGDLRQLFPKLSPSTLRPVVSLMVTQGRLKRAGIMGLYEYSAPKTKAPAAAKAPPSARAGSNGGINVRAGVLAACLAGPKSTADLYALFPAANKHTVESAVSGLAAQGKVGRSKIGGERGYMYGPPGMTEKSAPSKAPPAPRGAHIDRVLAACKTPVTFGALSAKVSDINAHVLHQTVYALVRSKRLSRSGKRGTYLYVAT